jgi:hypothetical protein
MSAIAKSNKAVPDINFQTSKCYLSNVEQISSKKIHRNKLPRLTKERQQAYNEVSFIKTADCAVNRILKRMTYISAAVRVIGILTNTSEVSSFGQSGISHNLLKQPYFRFPSNCQPGTYSVTMTNREVKLSVKSGRASHDLPLFCKYCTNGKSCFEHPYKDTFRFGKIRVSSIPHGGSSEHLLPKFQLSVPSSKS